MKNVVFIVLFFLIIIMLPASMLARGQLDISYDENRSLNKIPEFNMSAYIASTYQDNFENALNDQIFFAKEFKKIFNTVKLNNTKMFNYLMIKYMNETYVNNEILDKAEEDSTKEIKAENIHTEKTAGTILFQPGKPIMDNGISYNENKAPEASPVKINANTHSPPAFTLKPLGSRIFELGDTGFLLFMDKPDIAAFRPALEKRIQIFNMIQSKNENVNFYIYHIERVAFMKDYQKYLDEINSVFTDNLDDKISFNRFKIDSYEKHMKYNFKTDMHWNCEGSYKGYHEIRDLLNITGKPVEITGKYTLENVHYVGSNSVAIGSYDKFDIFSVYSYELPPYIVYVNGEKSTYGYKESEYDRQMVIPDSHNPYNYFFGGNFGELIYDFSNNKKNLLMVVESYSNPINELIASHYNKTFVVDMRFYKSQCKKEFNLKEYIEKNGIEDVLFMGNINFFINDVFLVE